MDKYPAEREPCRLCQDTGTMSWQQPTGDDALRTIEMPCPNGCGGHWKHPAAESHRVIEQDNLPVSKHGRITEANEIGGDFIQQALERWGIEHPRD